MDVTSTRRASSAGYRFPGRSRGPATRSAGRQQQPAANRASYNCGAAHDHQGPGQAPGQGPGQGPAPDSADVEKQDQLWKELVFKERRAAREWENKWSFLLNCDSLGRPRKEEPLPAHVPFFTDGPSTTSQLFNSRLSSPLGMEVIRLDRLCLWPASQRYKHKPERSCSDGEES